MKPFRWGILSTGRIAHTFAEGLAALPHHQVAAVGSRRLEKAKAMADPLGARAHGSYEALAADPELDAIYVATPHSRHLEDALTCLEGGKHVLCEKPLTINEQQGARLVQRARDLDRFLMEAMWTRFNPVTVRVRELVSSGALGELRSIHADFGFRGDFDPKGRLFDPDLAGGALLDVGVYCVAYVSMLFGTEPEEVVALADMGSTGVDEQCAWVQRHPGARMASLSCAVRTDTPQELIACGTEGTLRVPQFWSPERLQVNGAWEEIKVEGNGYHYQAAEVERCVRAGLRESPVIPHEESLAIARTMDRVRAEIGLRYPGEA